MEAPQIAPRPATSIVARVFFFLAGLITLGIGVMITLGAALIGGIATGITAWVLSRKQRRLTRRGAWLASVVGTVGVLTLFMAYAVIVSESNAKPLTAEQRAEQRARATEAMPEWLRALNPNAQKQTAAADSMAAQLLENKAVVVWAGLMGAVIASALIGTIAGSFAWGGVMLMYRSFQGDWMPSSAQAASGGT